ncbi:MAG: segregation/condensation protein A [Planctomycetes bacterium]|nr:segregation/condensation protein A [Planctomycetota bacterium]
MSTEYRVQLDIFSGPLDLLLFLLKRDELDIQDIPIVRITDQYVAYVRLLENLDPNTAGDFLVMASTLIEMKSRALLPTPPLEGDNEEEDARLALVKQLLEYKRFKDAARSLGTSADDRSKRFTRQPTDLPAELRGVELEEVEVWDLLSAFGRVMTAIGRGPGVHEVRYDDTPLETYVEEISAALLAKSAIPFHALFEDRTSRAEIVGLFLALLELIRRRRVRAEQEKSFGVIYLFAIEEVDQPPEDPPQVATADAATLLPPTAPSGLDDEWSAAGEFPPIEPHAARDTHEEREPAD